MNYYIEKWVEETNYITIWHSGIFGLTVGDALGVPVQFMSESEIKKSHEGPVTGMRGGGAYNKPAGTWSDDSSMALATMASLAVEQTIDLDDIMTKFYYWLDYGSYTPDDEAFDQGNTCSQAINAYQQDNDPQTCGATGEYANGNGALMRILPVCLFLLDSTKRARISDKDAIAQVHSVAALTHNTLRSNMCCGFYYFMVKAILDSVTLPRFYAQTDNKSLQELLQEGISNAAEFYSGSKANLAEMKRLSRILQLDAFKATPRSEIKSSGYVIDTIEAAVWCLINTDSYRDCMLKAVNLGDDTDTVAAVAGGLAGLFYGYENIPGEWLAALRCKDVITEACLKAGDAKFRFGTDPEPYCNILTKILHEKYDFATRELIDSKLRLEIKVPDSKSGEDNKEFVFTYIYSKDSSYTQVKAAIDTTYEIISQAFSTLNDDILNSAEVIDVYCVPFNPVQDDHGYNLERYEVSKLFSGDFKIYIQEGDRVSGGGYSGFLPRNLIPGRTFSEVLDLMPLAGQDKADLLKDGQLKGFLGVKEPGESEPPKLTIVSLPQFKLLGQSIYCRGSMDLPVKKNILENDTGRVDDLWADFHKKIGDYERYGKRNADGSFTYWGVMSDDNPEYHNPTPWWHFGRSGYYFAGLEVAPPRSTGSKDDVGTKLPDRSRPDGWAQCNIPAADYVVVDVTPETYDEIYESYFHNYIPASGYMVCGAVMDCINSKTGESQLYFAVRKMK